ncbi:MAG: hypothetical protein ABI434_07665 [Burkholderiaceae bacterium]
MYGNVRCPVKIVWGALDPWIPLDRGKALNREMPQAEFEALAGVGHLPQLEAPDQVLEVLANFLN